MNWIVWSFCTNGDKQIRWDWVEERDAGGECLLWLSHVYHFEQSLPKAKSRRKKNKNKNKKTASVHLLLSVYSRETSITCCMFFFNFSLLCVLATSGYMHHLHLYCEFLITDLIFLKLSRRIGIIGPAKNIRV